MNYTDAARALGCSRTKLWRYATELGVASRTEQLDDVAIEVIREAIRDAMRKTVVQVHDVVGVEHTHHGGQVIIITGTQGEQAPLSPHFWGSQGQCLFDTKATAPTTTTALISPRESSDQPPRDEDPSIASPIGALARAALSDIESVIARCERDLAALSRESLIATRRLELAALKRARTVLERNRHGDPGLR